MRFFLGVLSHKGEMFCNRRGGRALARAQISYKTARAVRSDPLKIAEMCQNVVYYVFWNSNNLI